jgi:hypothetical protein
MKPRPPTKGEWAFEKILKAGKDQCGPGYAKGRRARKRKA